MSDIDAFTTSAEMHPMLNRAVVSIHIKEKVNSIDLEKIVIWLVSSLMHLNTQWPGEFANATTNEYASATLTSQGKVV